MTVSTTGLRITHNGNGVTTEFAFPFRFLANGDLQVILIEADGTEVAQVLNTNYTVAGVGVETGGTVTMLVAPAAGQKVFIRRHLGLTQEIDYITGDRFPAETHETALDRLTMISQQVDEEVARSVKLPPTSEDDPDDLVASLFAARDSAEADAVQTAADRVQTGLDRVATGADRVQTGLDRVAVAADLVQTDLDTIATAADRVAVAADLVQTDLDTIATAADRVQTGLDAVATAADRVQTGLDVIQTGEDLADLNLKYMGSFASAPVATLAGQIYFDTTLEELRVWTGAEWRTLGGEAWNQGVPDTIAALESVVIPAGRTVVHPNLTVEGTLTVDGTLFVPSGGVLTQTEVDVTDVKGDNYFKNDLAMYACRAWVNFDGTTTPPTIRASENVSSVARNSTGNYTVNFATAIQDTNYSTLCFAGSDEGNSIYAVRRPAQLTTSVAVQSGTNNGWTNVAQYNVAIFR